MDIKISPSILSADFARLSADVDKVSAAEMLHIDVMDGHFVPNISIGTPVVKSLRKASGMFFDVHLMISDPLKYVAPFVDGGADLITFHVESDSDPDAVIAAIREKGKIPAISVKPKTPAQAVYPYLDKVGMVLVMTVEPGFGGQSFMADMLPKIKALRQKAGELSLDLDIQVDGGIDLNTAPLAAAAGANVLVAGSSVFGSGDPAAMVKKLREAARAAYGRDL
ncbi:MAG: ribulose-phosphate 3-epimerase [Clostridiales bacterium]|nr:ribulose-phosphate 3-epimerase [Clostridiales bacterium]